jgi:hypothetical protein
MDLIFSIKNNNPTLRHLFEHLLFYRTKNFEEAHGLEKEIRNILKSSKRFDHKYTVPDIAFVIYKDVTAEVCDILLKEVDTSYFTKEDFELEKKVFEIEHAHYNDTENIIFYENFFKEKIESSINLSFLNSLTYEEAVAAFKNTEIKVLKESKVLPDSDIFLINKTFKEKTGCVFTFGFEFQKNNQLYDLVFLLEKCISYSIFGKYIYLSERFENSKYRILFNNDKKVSLFKFSLLKLAVIFNIKKIINSDGDKYFIINKAVIIEENFYSAKNNTSLIVVINKIFSIINLIKSHENKN